MIYLLYIYRTIGNNLKLLAAGQKYLLSNKLVHEKNSSEMHILNLRPRVYSAYFNAFIKRSSLDHLWAE